MEKIPKILPIYGGFNQPRKFMASLRDFVFFDSFVLTFCVVSAISTDYRCFGGRIFCDFFQYLLFVNLFDWLNLLQKGYFTVRFLYYVEKV